MAANQETVRVLLLRIIARLGKSLMQFAIVLRHMRAVVSQRIETPQGPGWDCALNWEDLEIAAFQAIGYDYLGGPYVFSCPFDLADQAIFASPALVAFSLCESEAYA